MKAKLRTPPKGKSVNLNGLPPKLLTPLIKTGVFKRFKMTRSPEEVAELDALLPATMPLQELAMLGPLFAIVYGEWLGDPVRTSLTGHWVEGDVLYSAAWTHEPDWTLDISVFRSHPRFAAGGLGIRIYTGDKPGGLESERPNESVVPVPIDA